MIAYLGSKHFTDRDSILAYMDSVTRGVKLVAVDVETISLVNLTPVGVGFAPNAEDAFYFTTYPELDSDFPWEIIQSPDIRKIHHNALFDLSSIDEFEPDANVDDTTLMAHLLNLPADLVTLSSIFLPGTEVHGMEEYLGKGQTTQDLDPGLLARKCCQDCLATYRLHHELHPLVDSSYYEVERQLIPILVEMSLKGLKIDHEERERLGQKLEADMGYYRSICDEYDFNPGSHQQVGHILAKRGNILPFRRRRDREGKWKMKLVTVEEELEKLSDPLAAAIINYRHAQKALSTYIKPYAGKVRAFTRWHMDAVTGRITSTRRNMQNIPPELRSMFVPDNGVFTDWDASQLELRILANISGDRAMAEIYETGGDIHQHTADFMGIDRRPAKNVNFAMVYGATDQTIAETAHITSIRRAHELKERWFDAYPDAGLWIIEQQRVGVTEGYVETLYGRKIKVDMEDEQGAMRKAVNYPIQGSAAEIIKRAMIKCRELPLVLQVHDELIADGDVTQQVLEAGLERLSPVYTPYDIKTVRRWE